MDFRGCGHGSPRLRVRSIGDVGAFRQSHGYRFPVVTGAYFEGLRLRILRVTSTAYRGCGYGPPGVTGAYFEGYGCGL